MFRRAAGEIAAGRHPPGGAEIVTVRHGEVSRFGTGTSTMPFL
jgi:hypothetical protein